MTFIRPEARAAVAQWREALVGGVVLLLGIWWASGFGVMKWLGIGLVAVGAVLIVSGLPVPSTPLTLPTSGPR